MGYDQISFGGKEGLQDYPFPEFLKDSLSIRYLSGIKAFKDYFGEAEEVTPDINEQTALEALKRILYNITSKNQDQDTTVLYSRYLFDIAAHTPNKVNSIIEQQKVALIIIYVDSLTQNKALAIIRAKIEEGNTVTPDNQEKVKKIENSFADILVQFSEIEPSEKDNPEKIQALLTSITKTQKDIISIARKVDI